MQFRQARAEELAYLAQRLEETGSEDVGIDTARLFVAVDGGKIVGVLAARMVWQLQPLTIFPEVTNKMTRRRAGIGMYQTAQAWLGNRILNQSGIYWFFAVTRSNAVKGWLTRLGMLRQYRGAATFLKYL